MSDITIKNVLPKAALPGGEVVIEYAGRELAGTARPEVRFGDFSAQVTVASNDHIIARVPESSADIGTHEVVVSTNGDTSRPFPYEVGKKLASNLHPVANPALDADGNIYATYSGRRGQKTPVSIYKVTPKCAVTPFVTDIMNATGLAFSLNGELFVSSRNEGNVYRVDRGGRTELYIEGMGIASGIALDHDNNLYVGDRSGSIFKISPDKEIFVFATLEPSIAAYHLAFGFDDYLYVTGPTTSSFDSIYRVSPSGEVVRFFTGLGRPQGLAFDIEGVLYAVASYRGRRGIFRFRDPKKPELIVAGLSLVGLAFDQHENLMIVDSGSLYRVRLGIMGKPLP
jgi:outer membrane protein assembly factor BamB